MRVSSINSHVNRISFGYDKQLNLELRENIKALDDRDWADTLSGMNLRCNKLEELVDKYSKIDQSETSKYQDYLDLFLTMKQMLAGFVSVTFENLKFADREYKHYQDEYVRSGSPDDGWQKEICDYLTEWTEDIKSSGESGNESPVSSIDNRGEVVGKHSGTISDDKSFLEKYIPSPDSPNGFVEVSGMADLKRDLQEGILDYIADPQLAKQDMEEYGLGIPKGILLYGPPGCGKTYITEALSSEAHLPLYKLNISKAGSQYINMTSKNIQEAFDEAIKIAEESGKPCLLFMDEIDTLAFDRNSKTDNEDIKQVGTMLQAIDKAQQHNVILIGATNKYNLLDPAIIRRFEDPYFVNLPDKDERFALLNKILTKKSKGQKLLESEDDMKKVVNLLDGYSNKSICIIALNAAKQAKRRNRADISVDDFIQAIKTSAQEKPNKKDYMPDSQKNTTMGFSPNPNK